MEMSFLYCVFETFTHLHFQRIDIKNRFKIVQKVNFAEGPHENLTFWWFFDTFFKKYFMAFDEKTSHNFQKMSQKKHQKVRFSCGPSANFTFWTILKRFLMSIRWKCKCVKVSKTHYKMLIFMFYIRYTADTSKKH